MKIKKKKLFKFHFKVMGCPCNLDLYCYSKKEFIRVKSAVIHELIRLDQYYTNYSDTSFTAEINRSAGPQSGIIVDEETAALLDYSHECFIQSGGLFDITAGTLRAIWDYHQKDPVLPQQHDIDELLKAVGWDKVIWNKPHLQLPIEGMVLDFGGVVKEYAADVAAGICYTHKIYNGVINLGGDLRILGPHADGKPWRLGIADPKNPTRDITTILLTKGAIASSGNYERYIEIDGKKYGHILNPITGWPVDGFSGVSVLGDYCLVAGSAATIASLKPKGDAIAWLDELGLPYICIDQEGKIYRNC